MTAAPQRPRIEPFFMEVDGLRLFALQVAPPGPAVGSVLYLPPFAEEMNRLRNHASAAARAMAGAGWRCLLLDPFGTGESDGDTEAATWERWHADGLAALQWLRRQGSGPVVLWGARTGALLAGELARSAADTISRVLLWQPVTDGGLYLNQYLRLRVASQLVHDGEKETTESIRQQLAAGHTVEVAGYPLSPALADALGSRKLLPPPAGMAVDWIEIVGKAEQPAAVGSRRWADMAIAGGTILRLQTVVAPMVWQIHGREDAPALVAATVDAMVATTPAGAAP